MESRPWNERYSDIRNYFNLVQFTIDIEWIGTTNLQDLE